MSQLCAVHLLKTAPVEFNVFTYCNIIDCSLSLSCNFMQYFCLHLVQTSVNSMLAMVCGDIAV